MFGISLLKDYGSGIICHRKVQMNEKWTELQSIWLVIYLFISKGRGG